MSITILAANLLTSKISSLLSGFRTHFKPLTFTLAAMAIIIIILYPLYSHLEKWLTLLSANIVKTGKSFGGKYVGLFLMFFLCLAILLCFYAKMWYQINVIHLLLTGQIDNYF
jgi:predicted PurR-regulated permease PerM